MDFIQITSEGGRIGALWWINAVCEPFEIVGLYGLVDNLSAHLCCRTGSFGIGCCTFARLQWRIVATLN